MMRAAGNFVLYMKQNFLPMFYRVPMGVRVTDALYQAQVDMLAAEHNAEYWTYQRDMLQQRMDRLRRLTDAYPVALQASFDDWKITP